MKEKQDYNHWWDRGKIQVKDIGNTQYMCCMNPTAGSFIVNPRLQRHFWTCAVPFPEQAALRRIYETFLKGHFERLPFKQQVQAEVSSVILAALQLHNKVVETFRKTAANFHYEFNIRHMSGVFAGLLAAKPSEFDKDEKIAKLWLHESERVYGDRLVSVSDLKKYRVLAAELSKKQFSKCSSAFGRDDHHQLYSHRGRPGGPGLVPGGEVGTTGLGEEEDIFDPAAERVQGHSGQP
jgi:dynein heavy chain